jgi:hypothetical protein
MKMQIFLIACLCAGSWSAPQDDSLSLIQASISRRAQLAQQSEEEDDHGIMSGDKDLDLSSDNVSMAAGASCSTTTSCKITLTKIATNDLDKGGELRYSDVCTVKGQKIDLVVTTTSDYWTKKPHMNGLSGIYGQINLNAQTGYEFTFSFYKSGSSTPITIDSFYFTMFDTDGWYKNGQMKQKESHTFSGFQHFSVGGNCELERQISPAQSTFTATTGGGVADNPTDPKKLTDQQLSRSVTFLYKSVSTFKAKFEILGPSKFGTRNFIFAGESSLSESCGVPVCRPAGHCKLTFNKVKQNNLGGKGPQTGAAELRYEAVCTVAGTTFETLDLAVTATSPYVPAKSVKNGINGAYGQINLQNRQKGDFLFSFYKTGTNTPFTLSSTSFTIFDIDSGKAAEQEVIRASGYASYTMGNNTELKVETDSTSVKLSSTTYGVESDNPKDPMALTAQQRARSATFVYESVNSFPLSFEITGGKLPFGRNLLFAGESSLNELCFSSKP